MITRGQNFKAIPLNIVGSSVFGRYPKISTERTVNMFQSDTALVDYAGYQVAINSTDFLNGKTGRGCFNSTKLNRLVIVISNSAFLVNILYNQQNDRVQFQQVVFIGQLQTSTGVVYITENNKPQILISDNQSLYIYDPTLTPTFQVVSGLDFVPGYITFHDTYFIASASQDTNSGSVQNNTWRLSGQNDGLTWSSNSSSVGELQTKPDNTQAVLRFPSKGNMIFVMGSIVTEAWNDLGLQLFPYARQNQFNIDYGCLSPATVAYTDEIVVWLAQNEKSGPIILYSNGGMPKQITTDGIDYLFSQLQEPQDSQAFVYRQDGHLFYHINFYSDNISLFFDFLKDGTTKVYNACDENGNYFIASEVAFFDNQYYFVSRNTGNLYAFDTIFTTFQDTDALGNIVENEIPRIRICKNVRDPDQDYFIANDIGFTIETGETNYQQQSTGYIRLITQCGNPLITQYPIIIPVPLITQNHHELITQDHHRLIAESGPVMGSPILLITQDDNFLMTQDGHRIITQQTDNIPSTEFSYLIAQQNGYIYATPCVDLSVSYDGGASFGNEFRYQLNPIGLRKNRLLWWQGGIANDLVCMFKFWGIGRFVALDGVVNIRI